MLKTVTEQGRFYLLSLEGEDIDIFLIIHRQSIKFTLYKANKA